MLVSVTGGCLLLTLATPDVLRMQIAIIGLYVEALGCVIYLICQRYEMFIK